MTFGQKKLSYYAAGTILGGLIGGITTAVLGYVTLYVASWVAFGMVAGSCIARVAFHLWYDDSSAQMWQTAIYHMVVAVGIIGLIFSTGWGWISFWAAVLVAMVILALGTRFLEQVGGTLKLVQMEAEKRFYPKGDVAGEDDDTERPVCLVDGKALTIKEAEAAGMHGAAQNAREKLCQIYGINIPAKEE